MDEHIPNTPHDDDIPPHLSDTPPDEVTDYLSGWGGEPFESPPLSAPVDTHPPIAGAPYQPPAFEDLTLGAALGYLLLRPLATGRRLWRVLTATEQPITHPARHDDDHDAGNDDHDADGGTGSAWKREPESDAATVTESPDVPLPDDLALTWTLEDAGAWFQTAVSQLASVFLLLMALIMAVHGGMALHNAALNPFTHAEFDTHGAERWFWVTGAYVGLLLLWEGRGFWQRTFPATTGQLGDVLDQPAAWRLVGGAVVITGVMHALLLLRALLGRLDSIGWADPWYETDWVLLALVPLYGVFAALIVRFPVAASGTEPGQEPNTTTQSDSTVADSPQIAGRMDALRAWMIRSAPQVALIPVAVLFSLLTYSANVKTGADGVVFDIVITTGGAWAWLLSVIMWIVVLGVDVAALPSRVRDWSRAQVDWAGMIRRAVRRIDWPLIALAVIVVVGAWFRLLDLEQTPPEMTSDHIEKLLDAVRVHDGYYAVFFPNNGGREAFQMYFVEFIADELGVGFNFNALKWATVIEGILTLPAVWWMAQQVTGTHTENRRQLGRWTGVGMAGLLALSSWHLMLSRLGLRIALTPLTTALVIGFTARVMRHDRMRDWLALGTVLGAGIYFYQANRMLPLIVIAGTGLALLMRVQRGRDVLRTVGVGLLVTGVALGPLALLAAVSDTAGDVLPFVAVAWWAGIALLLRGGRSAIRPYAGSASSLLGGVLGTAVVALALAIPMLHYIDLYPDQFWNRTRGRLYGENAFVRENDDGVLVSYDPTTREQWDRFWDQRDVFEENYVDALRMYHWEGDGGWISNASGYPALGAVMGGLLILGVILGGVWVLRERDWVMLLLPVSVLIMLLPSALTLAYTIENPSFTRASGTIPAVFMLAGLPLGWLFWRLSRIPVKVWRVPLGGAVALLILVGVWNSAYDWNRTNFYTDYHLSYSYSWKPYREIARPLRAFAEGEGSYGNAFVVAYPHWLDHRVLGAMAGDIRWPNGLIDREQLIPMVLRNQGTPYQYDPGKPLFVMVHLDDPDTLAYLEDEFPGGSAELYDYAWQTGINETSHGQFYIYTVMAGDIVAAAQ